MGSKHVFPKFNTKDPTVRKFSIIIKLENGSKNLNIKFLSFFFFWNSVLSDSYGQALNAAIKQKENQVNCDICQENEQRNQDFTRKHTRAVKISFIPFCGWSLAKFVFLEPSRIFHVVFWVLIVFTKLKNPRYSQRNKTASNQKIKFIVFCMYCSWGYSST